MKMEQRGKGFYDLSVLVNKRSNITDLLTTLSDRYDHSSLTSRSHIPLAIPCGLAVGYRTIALNQVIEESAFDNSKKSKKKGAKDANEPIPPPLDLTVIPKVLSNKLRILNRITVYFSETATAHKMVNSENYRKYDIQAVVPTSLIALQHTCKSLNIDIISIDPCNKSPLRWNRKLYNLAADRGIWFELPYANSVVDATARKILINTGHMYHAYGKSKNILISSGAESPMQVRGPYDIVNLGLLLGLSEEQAKSALTHAGRSMLLQADGRKRGKAVILMERICASQHGSEPKEQEEVDELQPQPKKRRADSDDLAT